MLKLSAYWPPPPYLFTMCLFTSHLEVPLLKEAVKHVQKGVLFVNSIYFMVNLKPIMVTFTLWQITWQHVKYHRRHINSSVFGRGGSVNQLYFPAGLPSRKLKMASKEHVLAVSRDYISQPRLSKCLIILITTTSYIGNLIPKRHVRFILILGFLCLWRLYIQ